MVDEVALKVARAEVRRAGGNPAGGTLLAWVLMGISALTGLAALSWLLFPYPPVTTPEVAARTFYGSAAAVGVFWALGRLWTRGRIRDRARHIGLSPNLSPGIWALDSRTLAGVMIGFLCVMAFALLAGFRIRASGKEPFVGAVLMVIAGLFIPVVVGAVCQTFRRHRKLGGSRFVPIPDATHWLPGQELAGVLEVRSWFGGARAVLFELVQTTREHTDGPFERSRRKRNSRVVASVTVRAEAFENPPGLIVVPMTLTVPPDAEPRGVTIQGACFPWQTYRSRSVRWSLRATAAEGCPEYQADFTIAIVAPGTIPTASRTA